MTDRVGYLVLVGLTVVIYCWMLFGTLPQISAGFGGQLAPDLRLAGYSYTDMISFLSAATPEGLAAYAGTHLYLDAVFPALLALSFALPINGLLRHRKVALRIIAILVPMAAGLYDYMENILVARMLAMGPTGITPEIVQYASRSTELKAVLNTVSFMLVSGLIIASWWDARRESSSR